MMTTPSRRKATSWVVGGTLAAAATLTATLGTGTAAAQDGVTSTTLYTLSSTGACAGTLTASVDHYPDEADLIAGGTLSGAAPCTLDVDFVFTSRADGHSTTFSRHFAGPGTFGLPGADVVSPGAPGVYDVAVKPHAAYLGGQTLTIDTTYHG
ncbi:hypothetical protein ACLQ3C_20075 [Gordonia sp. DT30]|uniref:hypothetical protein n=1 Tax=Gordonia sp. DT30 TaxID=3416546 RepID=UPI003CF89E81